MGEGAARLRGNQTCVSDVVISVLPHVSPLTLALSPRRGAREEICECRSREGEGVLPLKLAPIGP